MAGDARTTAPWPHGPYFPIQLGPVTKPAELTDTLGEQKVMSFKTPFAFNVKKAYLWIGEDTWVGAAATISVTDVDSTTLVATRTLVATDDNGAWVELTVNSEGPVLNNSEVYLNYDSDTLGEQVGLTVLLWVQPVYGPSGDVKQETS